MGIIRPASSYVPRRSGSGLSSGDLSFADAIVAKWGKEENKFLAVLDILASGQQGLAGVTTELARREGGHRPTPMLSAFNQGVARSASFSEVTGSPAYGLPLDIIIDPINIIGFGGVPKAIGKGITKIPGVVKVSRGIYEVTEASTHIRKVKEGLGELFRAQHLFRKRNPKAVIKLQEEHWGNVNYQLHMAGRKVADKVLDLVPDAKKRESLSFLMDQEPVIKQAGDGGFTKWREAFMALPTEEKTAYLLARTHLDSLEKIKIESGLLTPERVAGFYEKLGRKYVPFREATRDVTIRDIKKIKDAEEAAEPWAMEIVAKFDRGMKDLDDLLEAAEKTDDIWLPFRERARIKYKEGSLPSFAQKRGTSKTLEEAAQETEKWIESDMAKLLMLESKETAKAFADKEYVRQLAKFMRDKNLVIPRESLGDAKALKAIWGGKLSKKEIVSRMREGFEELKELEGMEGFVVPKTIAKEIRGVLKQHKSPDAVSNVIKGIQKIVQWDKAWRLMPFPEYHVRNYFSNKFNNFLGGVDPIRHFKHYKSASHMLRRWNAGIGLYDKTSDTGKLFGHSEAALYRLALKYRVIGGGETMGELGMAFDNAAVHKNIFKRWIDHRTSPITRKGFKVGRWVEDRDRLAHFFTKLDEGMAPYEAGRSVNKFLLDYTHGLSGFESQFLRNGLMPFYAWLRMNVPMQLEMLILSPHKYVPVVKGKKFLEDSFGGPEPSQIEEADWIRKNMSIRIGYDRKTGNYKYWLLNSWWPAADLDKVWGTKLGQEIVNQLNPWIKTPVEVFSNYSFFQWRKISRFKGEKKKLLGVPLNARLAHLLKSVRQVNTANKLLKLLIPEEGISWPGIKDGKLYAGSVGTAIVGGLFGKVYPQDPAKQKEWWERGISAQIRALKATKTARENKGDYTNSDQIDKNIQKLEDLKRKHLGI